MDTQFKSYLAIFSHDAREKEQLPTLEVLSKALEDEELRLANQHKTTANFAQKTPKKPDSKGRQPQTTNSSNTQATFYLCSQCKKTHNKRECWMNKTTCNGCGKTGHIKKFCKSTNKEKKEETNATSPEVSTTGLSCCVISPVFSPIPPSSGSFSTEADSGLFKSRMRTALACTNTVAATTPIYNTKVVLDCGATDHFFCNWEFFTTFTEYYHEFQTGSGQIVPAYGYGDVVLNLVHHNKAINVFTI